MWENEQMLAAIINQTTCISFSRLFQFESIADHKLMGASNTYNSIALTHPNSMWLNPLPHNPDFSLSGIRSLLKALWQQEKMLVTTMFSILSETEVINLASLELYICNYFQIEPV